MRPGYVGMGVGWGEVGGGSVPGPNPGQEEEWKPADASWNRTGSSELLAE